jgi:hypothetical protein
MQDNDSLKRQQNIQDSRSHISTAHRSSKLCHSKINCTDTNLFGPLAEVDDPYTKCAMSNQASM